MELICFSGYSHSHVKTLLHDHGIFPLIQSKKGSTRVYKKQDLAPLIEQWRWKRLIQTLDHWWQHFFPPACETCTHCQKSRRDPLTRQLYCSSNDSLNILRSVFTHFLGEIHRLGSITAWWCDSHLGTWNRTTCSAWGVVFIYLLDRRLLHLSNDELVQLIPIRNKGYFGMTRLWHNRCSEEYHQFLQAMNANYKESSMQEKALIVISLFVLLKYGLHSVAELGRTLSSEEILQVCSENRLITMHLRGGIYLPYPLTSDIRVGHVILDDIRHYFWQYAARQKQKPPRECWNTGPSNWHVFIISIIEQTLAAPMYEQAKGILSRRPETEIMLINPWRMIHKGKLANIGYTLLPSPTGCATR